MKTKAFAVIMLTAFLITALFYAVPMVSAPPTPIQIGIIGPKGWTVGEGMMYGAQLAADKINDAGGILGTTIEIMTPMADTLYDPTIPGYVLDPTPTTGMAATDLPMHIHLTWQNETNTTMTVTWQTSTSTAGDTVLYDTISRNGVPASYSYSASGFNYTYSGASGYIHNVELTDLTPDTVYYFICGGDTGGWSNERAFRTAPSVSFDVRLVVGGDSRTNIAEREKISKAMAKFNPAFVMHSGDMVNDGRIQSEWDSWFSDVDSHWIGENNLTIPIIPAVGNHEIPNDPATKYFVQFTLPRNERWYSYDWGPSIHIICLDSESSANGAQRDWLENDLAAHANYTWKFVIFHKPPFVSGSHSPWLPALTYWVPLFDKYHVDIVFNGHEHNYQRSYPLNWTASQTEPQDYSNGTVYIIAGSWGAPLYDPKPIWYMAYQNKAYHFCLVDVFKNGTLHLQAKDNQGNTFDEVAIHKPKIVGDVNGDGVVNIYDALLVRAAFGSKPEEPNWNPDADLNEDEIIDVYDALIVRMHYGEPK